MKTLAVPSRPVEARRRLRATGAPDPFSNCRIETGAIRQILHSPRPQAKLTVGAPDDAFEREADEVADQVMRMPEPGVQRMCHECEEEKLQAKEEPGQTPSVPHGFEQSFAALQVGGRPLPAS